MHSYKVSTLSQKKNRHTYQCEESVEFFLLVQPIKLKFHTPKWLGSKLFPIMLVKLAFFLVPENA